MHQEDKADFKDRVNETIVQEQKKLYLTALAITKNPHLAEDAMQEAFLKVLKNYASLKNIKHLRTWITKILVNECKNILKKHKKEQNTEYVLETQSTEFDDEEIIFFDMISNLNINDKTVVALRFFNGYDLETISIILGLPLSTVKSRLYRALEKLRKAHNNGY